MRYVGPTRGTRPVWLIWFDGKVIRTEDTEPTTLAPGELAQRAEVGR